MRNVTNQGHKIWSLVFNREAGGTKIADGNWGTTRSLGFKRGSSSLYETFKLNSQFEAVQQPAQPRPQALRSFIHSSIKKSSSLTKIVQWPRIISLIKPGVWGPRFCLYYKGSGQWFLLLFVRNWRGGWGGGRFSIQ